MPQQPAGVLDPFLAANLRAAFAPGQLQHQAFRKAGQMSFRQSGYSAARGGAFTRQVSAAFSWQENRKPGGDSSIREMAEK
jgi:hypothetical protein